MLQPGSGRGSGVAAPAPAAPVGGADGEHLRALVGRVAGQGDVDRGSALRDPRGPRSSVQCSSPAARANPIDGAEQPVGGELEDVVAVAGAARSAARRRSPVGSSGWNAIDPAERLLEVVGPVDGDVAASTPSNAPGSIDSVDPPAAVHAPRSLRRRGRRSGRSSVPAWRTSTLVAVAVLDVVAHHSTPCRGERR